MKHNLRLFTMLILALFVTNIISGQNQKYNYENNWGQTGFSLVESKTNSVIINYSVTEFTLSDKEISKESMKEISLPNVFLPNEAGKPNLPGESKMIAIPEGSKPILKIVNYEKEIIKDIEVAPAPEIPLVTDETIIYKKNNRTYSQNAFYPAEPFKISEIIEIRGVDAIILGVTPFQYNPVSKELIVYKNIEIEISFEGGKGVFGENKYRSIYWENILDDQLLNYNSLPKYNYETQNNNSKSEEADYVIITIDNADFIAKAEEIAEFRRKQGISTMVVTTTGIGGNTETAIETWIDNAYNNWTNPIDAVLLLGDYSIGTDGIISHLYTHPGSYPDFASDNKYADVNGDELPDVILARIAAENIDQLNVMVSKFIDYEQNPPTDASFYNNPITALGWQTERWFQICSEAIGGFWKNELGKNPVRINAVYEGDPSVDPWSSATNTSTVLNYFGPSGLGYIPAIPDELGGWTGGNQTDVANAINAGAFMLQHRDHGLYSGWGEPYFRTNNISSLTNVDNKLPFILSINCETGAYHNPDGTAECFTEAFHRYTYNGQNSGALGLIAASETSYSFVNDTYVWGLFDNMWPNFMPDETADFPVNFVLPAFANAAGKHFLEQSSWPYNTGSKDVTYRLFHHHGDAYLNVYTEVPQNLTVNCPDYLIYTATTLDLTVDENATIAVTYFDNTEQKSIILGTAISSTGATSVGLTSVPDPGTELLVTITKQDYFRYTKNVTVTAPTGPFDIVSSYLINDGDNNQAEFAETFDLDLSVKNIGVATSSNATVTLTTTDTYVQSLSNNTNVNLGNIAPDATVTSSNSFTVELANNIPDGHDILFNVSIADDESATPYESNITINVNAPELVIVDGVVIDDSSTGDDDGILDQGETADLIIQVTNDGNANVTNLIAAISSSSTDLTINSNSATATALNIGQTTNFIFNVTASASAIEGTVANVLFNVTAGVANQYSASENKEVVIGFVPEYCDAGANTADEFISRVQFVNIDNSSVIGSTYNDYTNISTDVSRGGAYPITITNGNHYSSDQIGCWIDWNYDGDFEDANETITISYSDPDGTGTIIVPNDARIGTTTMRLRVTFTGDLLPCGNTSYGEVEDYTLNVLNSTCTPPSTQATNFNTSAIGLDQMTINWTRGNGDAVIILAKKDDVVNAIPSNGTNYNHNSTFGSGDEIGTENYVVYDGTGTSVTIDGLEVGATYHFAIFEYNTTDNCYLFPELTGSTSVSCDAFNAFPLTEGFESGNLPTCWSYEGTEWTYENGGHNGNPANANTGSYNALFYHGSSTADVSRLVTRQLDFAGYSEATLTFFHTQAEWPNDQDELRVYYKESSIDTWGLLETYTNTITEWTQETITLPNLSSDYYVAFEATGQFGYGVAIDDIGIDAVEMSCIPPSNQATNFGSSSIVNTEMNINWSRGNGNNVLVLAKEGSPVDAEPVNGINYTYDATFRLGDEIGSGNFVVYDGTLSNVRIDGLTGGTTYHFAVFEYNTTDDCYLTPGLTGDATTTDLCPPCYSYGNTTFETSTTLVQFNTINNSSGKETDVNGNAYSDFTNLSTDVYIGESHELTVNVNTDGNWTVKTKVWIDWNQDCSFDYETEEYDLGSATNTDDGPTSESPYTITIPENAVIGNTTMRVSTRYFYPATSCQTNFDGEVEDYTINVNEIAPFFWATSTAPIVGETVTFTDDTEGTPNSYSWNFGDGATPATATGIGPHDVTYSTSGLKTVSMQTNGNNTFIKNDYIHVLSEDDVVAPSNLNASITGNDITLNWDKLPVITDNFDIYGDYLLSFGEWSQNDVDGSSTYGVNSVDFPNENYTGSFILFNPHHTKGTLTGWDAHSGSKYAACFASTTQDNDDWLVSPQVPIETGDNLSFWAKSITDTWGLERFTVAISTTGTDPSDFTVISPGSYIEAPTTWTNYTYSLNSYAGDDIYIAINCVSSDAFVFMLDDITITSAKGVDKLISNFDDEVNNIVISDKKTIEKNSFKIEPEPNNSELIDGYEIYRNGSLISTISDLSVNTYEDIDQCGTNNYYIKAKYAVPNLTSAASNTETINSSLPEAPTTVGASKTSVCSGGETVLLYSGGSGINFEWYSGSCDGISVGSGNNVAVNPTSQTTYYGRWENDCGESSCLSVTISIIDEPTAPISVEATETSVCSGDATVLKYTGGSGDSFEWYSGSCDGTSIGSGNNLTVNPITETTYYGRWENDCGESNCLSVTVSILEIPSVSAHPTGDDLCVGDNYTLSVSATGYNLEYLWHKDNVSISGATNPTYEISNASLAHAGTYKCIVSNTCDSETSNNAIVNVYETTTIDDYSGNQTACAGADVTFSVDASGNITGYEWYKDATIIPYEDQNSLTLTNVSATDEANYSCKVIGTCGEITSDAMSLTITNSLTIGNLADANVCPGTTAEFSVIANGTGTSYQWMKNGLNLTDGGNISGTNSETLSIANVDATDEGIYTCFVQSSCGDATSNEANLTLLEETTITTQPESKITCLGETVEFSIIANNADSYQWKKDGVAIIGAENTNLIINNISATDEGTYMCVVTGVCGDINSADATLTLTIGTGAEITQQPQSALECAGENVEFSVVATNALAYQWKKDGVPIPGAESPTLSLNNITPTDEATYKCMITGECGNINSDDVTLTINPDVEITQQPQNISDCEGETVEFAISANNATTFQWKKDNVNIVGANQATLTLTNITTADVGSYMCVVSGECGDVNSNEGTLTILSEVEITAQPQNVTDCSGETVEFSVLADNATAYQWKKNDENIVGATSSALTLNNISTTDEGSYLCVVTGNCGVINSDVASLSVTPSAEITEQPQSIAECTNENVEFSVSADNATAFQWKKDNVNIDGETSSTLTLNNISASDEGTYLCVITGECGVVISNEATLEINPETEIITQPVAVTEVNLNETVILTVVAIGSNLEYQWLKDNSNIIGANENIFTINNVTEEDQGVYKVAVTGDCGISVSQNAILTVITSIETIVELGMNVYPNPNNGRFTIEFEKVNSPMEIQITDAKGQIIYFGNINSSVNQLDLGQQAAGLYIMKIFDQNSSKTIKFVIK